MKNKSTFYTLFLVGEKGWDAAGDFESAADAHEYALELSSEEDIRYLVQETHHIEEREAPGRIVGGGNYSKQKKSTTKKTEE